MEGVGSRLGRASSRYGQAPLFNGPVRKWKKQWVWVHLTPSSSSTVTTLSTCHHRNGNSAQPNNNVSSVRLCRWTPVPSTHSGDSDENLGTPEEPPKRKFRYTPIVVLEGKKKEAARRHDDETEASKMNPSTVSTTLQRDEVFGKLNTQNALTEEAQTVNKLHADKSHLDLDLSLKGHDDDHDLEDKIKDADWRERAQVNSRR